ncbi:hypothetical protein PFLUV_G00098160 [Perca fluviatilis]|uniref:Uncharacterized protein n=1 Tax=Perca fluviatilis TaxID=8168 RepID=A0A6A5FBB2_PERFL|nr:hypothetical protein PFLUV_G00098160 [Perca fluviatilis]
MLLYCPLIMPPSVPGLEGLTGLTGPIQQLAMHFLGQSGISQPQQGDSITFTDELRQLWPHQVLLKNCLVFFFVGSVAIINIVILSS